MQHCYCLMEIKMMDLQRTGPAPRSELNELLDCVRCNLAASDGLKHKCPRGVLLDLG